MSHHSHLEQAAIQPAPQCPVTGRVTLFEQQEVGMGVDVPASQSHWLLCARLYAVMILPLSFPFLSWESVSWWMGSGTRLGRGLQSVLGPTPESTPFPPHHTVRRSKLISPSLSPQRQEEQHRHRPSPWRVMYNLFMGLLPLPRDPGAPEMEPN